ncbi:hypothetical protein M0R45_027419 [Rubus argutus]|uniref:RING-type E3 ubiquitin transferase n=1 Tax=Rubus argutus TaxID=59490 RepID=A0AAW1X0D3_RUBAR
MAVIKHRKLFPAPISSNQTDCLDCVDCPYECYPYPDFYVPPPPPFPSIDQNDQKPPYLTLFLIETTDLHSPNQAAETKSFLERIKLIIQYGSSLPLVAAINHKLDHGMLLPKCSHAFHINCIDTWLRSHTNCPLCRAYIVSETLGNSNIVRPNMGSVDQNWEGTDTNEDTQMENSEIESELGVNNQVGNDHEICENRAGTEDAGEEYQVGDENTSKESCFDEKVFSSGGRSRFLSLGHKWGMSSVVPL